MRGIGRWSITKVNRRIFSEILRTRNFSGQIDDLLAMKRFPD